MFEAARRVVVGPGCAWFVVWLMAAVPAGSGWQLAREGMLTYHALASNGSILVSVGNRGDIWTSPDGVAWTKRANPDPLLCDLWGVTWGGGQFVAVGTCSVVLTSPDGITWTQQDTSSLVWPSRLRSVAYGIMDASAMYLAVGRAGKVASSTDAIIWEDSTESPAPSFDLNGIAYGWVVEEWVAVGTQGTILTTASEDPVIPGGRRRSCRASPTPTTSSWR